MSARSLLLAGLLVALPARAGDKEFDQLVSRLRTHYQKAPMGTGFLGFIARCFSPSGVSGLRMAIFEDVQGTKHALGEDFDAFVQRTVGPDRTPMIRVSRRNGERVFIYLQPKGNQAELLLVAAEAHDAVVMKMRLDPERLQEWMDNPEGMARSKGKPVKD